MKSRLISTVLGVIVVFAIGTECFAEVEWNLIKTLRIDPAPLDMAVSPDGRSIYVLVDGGSIHIYGTDGTLMDKIQVDSQIDQIKLGPNGEILYTSSRKDRAVQVIALDFVYQISIEGSPSKGPQDAPIVIAVFGDFQ
jgi:hypothetical protein